MGIANCGARGSRPTIGCLADAQNGFAVRLSSYASPPSSPCERVSFFETRDARWSNVTSVKAIIVRHC